MEVCGKNVLVCVCVWCESVCVFVCVVRCVYESTVVRRNSPRRKQSRSSQTQHVQHLNPPEKAYLCYENHAHNDTTLLWVLFPVLVPQAFFHTGGETSFFVTLLLFRHDEHWRGDGDVKGGVRGERTGTVLNINVRRVRAVPSVGLLLSRRLRHTVPFSCLGLWVVVRVGVLREGAKVQRKPASRVRPRPPQAQNMDQP